MLLSSSACRGLCGYQHVCHPPGLQDKTPITKLAGQLAEAFEEGDTYKAY